MKNRLLIPFALLVALGAIFVAGCGGDDDTSTTTGTSGASGASGTALTQEEFVSQGNAICAAGNKELDQAGNDIFSQGQKPTDAQLQQFADVAVPSIQGQIDAIRALTPPADIADDVTTFLDDAESALDQVKADPTLFEQEPFADVNKQATAIGLDECAS